MPGIHALNRGTKDKKGAGLPFYKNKSYLLTNNTEKESVYLGWVTPRNTLPSFQIWIRGKNVSLLEAHYEYPTKLSNTQIPIPLATSFLPESVYVESEQYFIFSASKFKLQPPFPKCGMYTLVLTFIIDGKKISYYSDEVTVS